MSRGQASTNGLWAAVDRLVDRALTVADLRSHRLELFAARRWRASGREIPEEIAQFERAAVGVALAVPKVLERVRAAYDGPAILHKGPEVAATYADPTLRIFGDIDLLVPDAAEAHASLLDVGFEPTGDPELYRDIHHLRPLQLQELPVAVEIHTRPKWVDVLPPPSAGDLLEVAVASTVADGFLSLPPAHHAVLLAVHSWAHEPLRRLRDLVDIAAVAAAARDEALAGAAQTWRVSRLWQATELALAAVFGDAPAPWTLRTWARNLAQVRERTVLENHLQRWLSNFSVLPPHKAVSTLPATLVREIRPEPDETWNDKLARTARALRNASRRRSEHEDELARETARR